MCRIKCILLLITVLYLRVIHCRFGDYQFQQFLQKIYSPAESHREITRRNTGDLTIPGNAIIQEPSSRDLDVGFAVGIKDNDDDDDDSDSLLNNHSAKIAYAPSSVEIQPQFGASNFQEPTSSKELNIGVYVDPKSGVQYYSPGFVPSNVLYSKPNFYDINGERPGVVMPQRLLGSQYSAYPATVFNSFRAYIPSHQPIYGVNPAPIYIDTFRNGVTNLNTLPYPYQPSFQQQLPENNYFPLPQDYVQILPNGFQTNNRLQGQYPYQKYFHKYFDNGAITTARRMRFASEPYESGTNQFLSSPVTESVYDTNEFPMYGVETRYPKNYRRHPSHISDIKYPTAFRNVFQIEEQVPKGDYKYGHPVVVRQEPQIPEVILDNQGTPIMSAQPFGERQVGTFKLKNDRGYKVLMNVPPIPTDGPTDGILVMEMKAKIYRPLT